jgi:superfamily II DNA helicase RecQ
MKRIVSQWGHDFRPAYLKFSTLKVLPKTLSGLNPVQLPSKTDIIQQLSLEKYYLKNLFQDQTLPTWF